MVTAMPSADENPFRRVLLAVDPSGVSPAALDLALSMARQLGADLAGMLIEDAALLRAATLPSASEIAFGSGEERPLDRERLERQLRTRAAHLTELLATRARAYGVRSSLYSVRGPNPHVAATELRLSDIMVLSRAARAPWAGLSAIASALLLYVNDADRRRAEALLSALMRDGDPLLAGNRWESVAWRSRDHALETLRARRLSAVLVSALDNPEFASLLPELLDRLDCPIIVLK
jgi:hypothetical protein